jgi:hypothetical protein
MHVGRLNMDAWSSNPAEIACLRWNWLTAVPGPMVDDPLSSYRWHPALSTLREARVMHSEHLSLTRAVVILTNQFSAIGMVSACTPSCNVAAASAQSRCAWRSDLLTLRTYNATRGARESHHLATLK